MGEAYFRGGRVENKETVILSNINTALLVILVLLIFPGIIFLMGFITWSSSTIVYSVLCVVVGSVLTASLLIYERKSRIEVVDGGIVLGGRLIPWSGIEDVKTWSETYREAEVESSPVIGYGMYGYAYGKTLPTSITHRRYRYIVLEIFHKNGVETVYFQKREFWPFVKTLSRILNQKGLASKWLRDLEGVSLS